MKVRRIALALGISLGLALPVFCQPFIRLIGGNNAPPNNAPASTSNPVPVSVNGAISGNVGVLGVNGTTISAAANPVATALYTGSAVNSATNPIFTTPGGVATGSITNATANIANTDTTISLATASRNITVKTDPSAAVVYVDFTGGAATTGDFRIDPGGSVTIQLGTAISSYHYIGASATGTISTLAN